ncbi:uncharacterized protein B0H18DRAFT_1124506 [Fomitopsis serialis]|uniref:uncharacterized protein n=1 Tax=Fomitopsis serialis TaxID=139415 RepID=UPI002007817E|nr:uncharacterized protein B0H18DRAFT_1124506 [Neoantrodia serialis]KAH9916041.1 hypothetical protein B0H18DRAFT_1124506 [Neoantrodia serialis]
MSSNVISKLYPVGASDPRLVYEPADAWGSFCSNGDLGTRTAGSSVTFTFNGTFVEVYGSSGSAKTSASFVLDGQQAVDYTSSGASSQALPLYHSSTLIYSQHTLKVTVQGDDPSLCLQQLQYTGTLDPAAPSTSSAPEPTNTQSLDSSPTTATSVSNHLPAGTICGIVIGSIVVLLLVIFTILRTSGHRLDDMPKSPPPPVGMDAFRKLLLQRAQKATMTRLASGPNSKKSSSNGTRSTAIFSSVVILTPLCHPPEEVVIRIEPAFQFALGANFATRTSFHHPLMGHRSSLGGFESRGSTP